MIKELRVCLIFFTAMLLFSSCRPFDTISSLTEDNQLSAKETCEIVYQALVDHDVETLIELFSKKANDACNLTKQINESFDFINGEIIEHGYILDGSGGETVESGTLVQKHNRSCIEEVKTDAGKVYNIYILSISVCEADSNALGVYLIVIQSNDDLDEIYKIGKNIDPYTGEIVDTLTW
ncbi:MAG: DUF5104 domain-containing protein [Ruminococcus sp.]|nr:DUF5104 domain-containing protein [Ruminococcus sp.]